MREEDVEKRGKQNEVIPQWRCRYGRDCDEGCCGTRRPFERVSWQQKVVEMCYEMKKPVRHMKRKVLMHYELYPLNPY